MDIRSGHTGLEQDITEVFTETFTASEGPDEGRAVGTLAANLMKTTPPEDLHVFTAHNGDGLTACIMFSRLTYPEDTRTVFILSPVAVRPDHQKTGIGTKLITHGLDTLRRNGTDYVTTYGDPDYYIRTGFRQITTDFAAPPLPLSQPIGWLGQSLTGSGDPLAGPSRCVPALNRPELW
ncbi:GNAT family N-acetyltransferase [Amaricoccus tamworthensis]|uniref:GNAT family N-acetyltransferase n=1 Tax=Amaricoccus tamworthensis TaxID=57002 RepID=UPI003C7DA9FD